MSTRTNRWMGPARLWWKTRAARRSGDIGALVRTVAAGADTAVGLRVGRRRVLLLLDPVQVGRLLVEQAAVTTKGPAVQLTRQMLGDGLLTSEGAPHDRARRLIAPAFAPRRLAGYTDTFAARTRARIATWQDGEERDIHDEISALTIDIVGRTLLGVDLEDRSPTIRGSVESALDRFGRVGGGVLLGGVAAVRPFRRRPRPAPPGGIAGPAGTVPPDATVPTAAELAVHDVVEQVLAERRNHPCDDRGDVVSALLAAGEGRDGLSHQEIHDQVITLMMAGHETSANALTWTLFLLGKHPHVQERLSAQAAAFRTTGPIFADLPTLRYARAVLSEAMRLYPPAWLLGRTLVAPVEFAGWRAPAGTMIGVSPLLLHRDARWFPDPDRFDPERWLDDRRNAVPRYAFLPFGTGPRACIGEQFAWAEATTVLTVIASNWRVHTDPALSPDLQYRVTLRPDGAVPVRLTRRVRQPP